ncbi:MAG: FG-GAP-like repeat-containing protein [Terriglobales bacterium]
MKSTRQQIDGRNKTTLVGQRRPAYLCALGFLSVAILVAALPTASFGQVPATFVNPIMYNGGSVIANYSPIPVQAVALGDFNNDGVPDLLTLDDNGNTAGVGILLGRGDGSFEPVSSVTTFSCTLEGGFVTGDFNNDGNLDFAVVSGSPGGDCNFNPGTLWIFLGNGAGGFTLKATYSEIGTPANNEKASGLIAADLRGNGHLDLIAIDPNNGLDVFLGNGDGTFVVPTAAVAIPCPGCSAAITAGDVNHDGKPDLVVASNNSSDGIFVLIGNGDGTFQSPVFYQQGSNSGALAVAIGQLIKSDHGDVVMGAGNGAYVYINNGDGTFKTPVLYGPSWINSIVITDINGDKKNDLVVSSYSSSAVWTMLGNGKGGFTAGQSFATDGYPNNIVVGDFNGDKKLDFATSDTQGQWVTVGLGNGDGTFRSSQSYGYTWSGTVSGIATADLNNDGNLDIIEAGGGTGVGITTMLGSSHGVFGSPISTAVGCGQANRGGVNAIAVGDVTGDGKADVVATVTTAGGGCPDNHVAVLAGSGNGKFKAPVYYSTGVTVQSGVGALADFNGDGKLDIVLSNADGSMSVLLNKGKGVYAAAIVTPAVSGSSGGSIVVGDFNNDGKLDIAITDYNQKQVNVLLGNGDGTFQAPIGTPSPIDPITLATGDFNHDGKLDLALTSWDNTGSLTIFTGNGNGTFNLGTTYAFNTWDQCQFGGTNPYWMGVADLNQDGKLDLAIAVQYSACDTEYNGQNTWGAAVVYTGNGDGTFNLDLAPGSPGPWVGGVDNSGIALGDFNRDGMIDMAVAGNAGWTSQDWVTIMQNNTQPVSVSPLAITFNAQSVGTKSAAQTVVVTNDESSSLAISKVALGGTDSGDFILKNGCGSSLLTGANCTLTVTFEPAVTGSRTATLSITDGVGTQTVSLTGTGK